MILDNFSITKEKKKSDTWKIFLILVIFILSIISIYFLFCHFKNKSQKDVEKNPLTNKKIKKDNDSLPEKKNWKLNINYQPVQPTQKEAEYQGEKQLPISSVGTEHKKTAIEANMLPRGSAILSDSGDLKKQGIKAIIHACPGSISKKKNENFRATIQGVIRSVQNAILLAEKNNYKSIAFCLIGSSFLDSIIFPNQGAKKERQEKLAEIIIKSAIEQRKNLEKIIFVDFGNDAFTRTLQRVGKKYSIEKMKGINSSCSGSVDSDRKEIKQKKKGIIDYSSHQCEAIVNSLNTEGEFISSGSFSGFIASKTGSEKSKIQKKIKENISEFNKRMKR